MECLIPAVIFSHNVALVPKKMGWKKRVIMLVVIGLLGSVLGHFVVEQKTLKNFGIKNNVWDQKKGYAKNGLFFGFVLNMNSLVQEKPSDYSVEAAKDIAEKYETGFCGKINPKKEKRAVRNCRWYETKCNRHYERGIF